MSYRGSGRERDKEKENDRERLSMYSKFAKIKVRVCPLTWCVCVHV